MAQLSSLNLADHRQWKPTSVFVPLLAQVLLRNAWTDTQNTCPCARHTSPRSQSAPLFLCRMGQSGGQMHMRMTSSPSSKFPNFLSLAPCPNNIPGNQLQLPILLILITEYSGKWHVTFCSHSLGFAVRGFPQSKGSTPWGKYLGMFQSLCSHGCGSSAEG